MLLSLFCGAGGLDLGFEQAGFEVGLAFDKNSSSLGSYRHNRQGFSSAYVRDVRDISPGMLDELNGGPFHPSGVIGGPPCQSFSDAVQEVADDDPRHELPMIYAQLLAALNARSPVPFFVMENVPGLWKARHANRYLQITDLFAKAGFNLFSAKLNACDYSTPQNRDRIFLVGLNVRMFPFAKWDSPLPTTVDRSLTTVRSAIGDLPEPTFFARGLTPDLIGEHPNHWCMRPRSWRFNTKGALVPGESKFRSFKTLSWDQPSYTVAFGHREVHVHPNCSRRLSVYEAMRLQGFPAEYELTGTLSSQFTQISEAVPPPMAKAVAESIRELVTNSQRAGC